MLNSVKLGSDAFLWKRSIPFKEKIFTICIDGFAVLHLCLALFWCKGLLWKSGLLFSLDGFCKVIDKIFSKKMLIVLLKEECVLLRHPRVLYCYNGRRALQFFLVILTLYSCVQLVLYQPLLSWYFQFWQCAHNTFNLVLNVFKCAAYVNIQCFFFSSGNSN